MLPKPFSKPLSSLFLIFSSCFWLFQNADAQINLSTTTLNFFSVYTNSPESLSVTLTNNFSFDFEVTDVNLFHSEVYSIDDSAFIIPAGGNHQIWVTCAPRHNLSYSDFLFIENRSLPNALKVFLFAQCKYPDVYYDPTQNLSHEPLKTALKTLLGTGVTDLGYNGARDKMYMEIDNQAVNGQGAAQNTLECIYTGELAVGYTSRADCQTNDLFNTEHTFPQAMFLSSSPMQSDLHHLFPTKVYANTERDNKPFGVVTNPTWTVGGSKSNGSVFEPRDVHKGRAARALFYMVIRYQDYTGFVAPQESILRQWALTFSPNAVDSIRNQDIFALQDNRNPFIDHPEYFERIASICTVNNGPQSAIAFHSQDTLFFGSTQPGNPVDGAFYLSNQGISNLTVSNTLFSDGAFSFINAINTNITRDSAASFLIRFDPPATNTDYTSTLTFDTNDPAEPTVTVVLSANSNVVGTAGPSGIPDFSVFPNPANGWLEIAAGQPIQNVELSDLSGRKVANLYPGNDAFEIGWELPKLSSGTYFLRVQFEAECQTKLIFLR